MGVAENIAALLAKYQISQNEFAASIRVSAPTVSRWRNGSMRMRQSTLERICATYDLVPDDILSDARGLAAQLFGVHTCSPTIPLVAACDIHAYASNTSTQQVSRIEVTSKLFARHPKAFAFLPDHDPSALGIPTNVHVIIDPAAVPRDGSIVVAVVRTPLGTELQRFAFKKSECASSPDIVGTVVWFQPADLLD